MTNTSRTVDEPKAQRSKSIVRPNSIGVTSILMLVAVVFVTVEASLSSSGNVHPHAWKTLSTFVKSACSQTPYPERCESSMASSPGHQTATINDLTNIALKVSMERAQRAWEFASSLQNSSMNERERAAWQDCMELFQDTMDRLNVCLSDSSIKNDVPTWLSAALTNQDTCLNGFHDLNLSESSTIRSLMYSRAVNLSELVSNSLSMHKLSSLSSTTVKNHRLLLTKDGEVGDFYSEYGRITEYGFPQWLSARDRRLLQSSSLARLANVVVAQDGSGDFRTVAQAVAAAPQESRKRYVIYIKAGIYKENIDIPMKMTNLMLIGDGKGRTVITGSKSVQGGATTIQSATIAALGNGFIARDMTFENTAGPQMYQAVALLVAGDHSVVYRCSIKGYQDTLYVYSFRQFFSEVDIYGTVDFIFGNAAVVIQNSNIFARRPMSYQQNTITAQGRTDANQNTGIAIHNCRVTGTSDLRAVKASVKTYLGRPWKQYSRTVFIQCILDDIIDPAGWLEWAGNFALKTLYYGEYMNRGAGAGTSRRVKWPGFHIIKSAREASQFTVGNFISGNSWIRAAGVAFTSGLNR